MSALLWLALTLAGASEVRGTVQQRGDARPLPEAELRLPDGTLVPLDERGEFVIELEDGVETTLEVLSLDHLGQTIQLTPPLDRPLRLFLEPTSAPGEIVVESFKPTADLTRHAVDAEMAFETPGTYDDAIRLVQALPAVNVQREFSPSSGEVSVRGSQAGDNRYYLDGIEVPYLYHFNQYASVFPASQLAGLELFPSTFGSRYGDAVGAIVEASSPVERPEDVSGSVGLNMVTVGADLKAPLPKRWWLSVAGRRSFHDITGDVTGQFPLWPRFYDFSVRAENGDADAGTGVFASGAGDRYARAVGELDVLDPVEQTTTPTLDFRRDYQLLGVRHRWKKGRFVAGVLHDRVLAEVDVGGRFDQRTLTLPMRLDTQGRAEEILSWDAGMELRPELAWLDVESAGRFGALVTREAPATNWGWTAEQTLWRLRGAGYTTLHAQVGPVRVMPGLRVGLDSAGWKPTIEPRLAFRFRLAEHSELRLAAGRYQQRPETVEVLYNPDFPTTDSWQVGGGFDQAIAGRLELSVDGYYKHLQNVLFQPAEGSPELRRRGEAWGAELTLRYRMRETFFIWAWFAYGRSVVHTETGERQSTGADQPFSGGLVTSWNILPELNVAARYRVASGSPYTEINGSTYDAGLDTWLPRYATTNGARLPTYQKIDLRVAYTFIFKKWSLALSADVWIVPKSSAQLYPAWNYDYTEQNFVIGPTVMPLLGLRATF